MRRTAAAIALLIVPLLALSGCAPTPPAVPAKPKPSSTPLFANEEEALKAATEAYAAYELALDKALATYDLGSLSEVATGKALASAKESVSEYRSAGKKQVGLSAIDVVHAADLSAMVKPHERVGDAQIYACLDVSAVDVIDSSGNSVVVNDSVRRFPILVTLTSNPSTRLLVQDESIWDGDNFCD